MEILENIKKFHNIESTMNLLNIVNEAKILLQERINMISEIEELLNSDQSDKITDSKDNSNEITMGKRIVWCDQNYLSLMGIIELLEYTGYIPENSYKNSGEIAANLFLKKDNSRISRKSFNNKKADYVSNKAAILGKIIDDLQAANKRILAYLMYLIYKAQNKRNKSVLV